MNEIENQIETMQKGFIDVLTEIELALISKQYDIAHNILRQSKKDIQEDLNKKEELVLKQIYLNNKSIYV